MGLFNNLQKLNPFSVSKEITSLKKEIEEIKSFSGTHNHLLTLSYDGEKNSGELGPVIDYRLDYRSLRKRSWQAYLDDEIAQTVIKKYVKWVVGKGLKLQSEPEESVLKSEGIELDATEYRKVIESRFKLYAGSKIPDYSRRDSLHKIAKTVYLNSIVGGDVLVILRFKKGNLSIQVIDGDHVRTPFFNKEIEKAEKRKNTIKNGIEQNDKKEHIAYHVRGKDGKFKRIRAKSQTSKREIAFMVYGLDYRIDDNRGIPIISTVLETLKKLDRYKEAAVGSAEERAKVVYTIEHDEHSTGENPLQKTMSRAFNVNNDQEIPTDVNNKQLADKIAVTTNKMTFNLPRGAKLKSLDSKSENQFKEFYGVNADGICSTIGIPPEVAFSKYESNFSASRAALKDWEHSLNVDRGDFSEQFYQKIYNFWLDMEVLQNKVQAPGYLTALAERDEMTLLAFRNARFVGANVPHIDPLKEVAAERLKLGESGRALPLTTAEAATEALNGGDYAANVLQYSDELKDSIEKGIEVTVKEPDNPKNDGK